MSFRRTNAMAGERYDLPELYMEIFWYYIQRTAPTYNLVHSEGHHHSDKRIFSLVHLIFDRPPWGGPIDPLKAIKTRRKSTRSRTSTAKPFRTPAKFNGDPALLHELEYFAKEICSMVDQLLSLVDLDERLRELEKQVGERMILKGDWCWLVIEQSKDSPSSQIAGHRKSTVDEKGRIHLKIEIRTLQPPDEWLRKNGKYAKWEGGADGCLKLKWWTESKYKENVSIDDTWTMVSDFEAY